MKKLFLLIALTGFIFSGCNPDCCNRSVIWADKDSIAFPEEGGDENVAITCSLCWKVIEAPVWVTVEPEQGCGSMVINIVAEPNNSSAFREGKIVLLADNGDQTTIVVTQDRLFLFPDLITVLLLA